MDYQEVCMKEDKDALAKSAYTLFLRQETTCKCNGCERLHIYIKEIFPSIADNKKNIKEYQYPSKLTRKQPNWIKHINIDYLQLVGEVYSAYNRESFILFSMGCRTIMDRILNDVIGDIGGFAKKLGKFKDDGHISIKQFDYLKFLIDAGNASAHRAFQPSENLARILLDIIEQILKDNILGKEVLSEADNIPQR
ncbi:hypothetical protein FNFX1_1021 [Francisella cf. novicida Fx1]|uniref:DUF4145 domain-containing protein n=2 Tax=Francisella tularensis TaxID=263 RepID=UPI00020BCEF3|nr:DUF4145 domain-containing protein [Francisella tularensis]AEE87407.1 hypothetical protein FNFX1_1021 [Francisella cf. novicida Fx1]APA83076.1 hypothetical protein N894_1092 [Francisella tularensis subsp. novicida PA10-7858]